MRHFRLLVIPMLFLAGCGSTMDGQSQEITLLTPGALEADCYFENPDFKYRARTGETVRIMKSKHDLNVHCFAPGNREKTMVVEREFSDWVLGDIALGGAPLVYDHFSRGGYKYPDVIRVDFTGELAKDYPLPAYHSPDIRSPWDQPIEYMGPSSPMVESDKQGLPKELQKRDENDLLFSNPFYKDIGHDSPAASSSMSMEPIGTPAGSSSMSDMSVAPSKPGTSADDLTRSMNPQVFN